MHRMTINTLKFINLRKENCKEYIKGKVSYCRKMLVDLVNVFSLFLSAYKNSSRLNHSFFGMTIILFAFFLSGTAALEGTFNLAKALSWVQR